VAAVSWRRSTSLGAAAAALLLASNAAGSQRSLPDRLRDYIERFEKEAAALVAEERYVQRLETREQDQSITYRARELRSDYVLIKPADTEPWLGYRDIFEVDLKPVRERDARLVQLLSSTAPDSIARAAAFAREGARFNLGPERTVNTPTMPLELLARIHAPRFRVRAPRGWERETFAYLTFEERVRPTIVRTPEGASVQVSGAMKVRVSDGAVFDARLRFRFSGRDRPDQDAMLLVEYGDVPGISVPVPIRMTEELPMPEGKATGVATYSNYRRFQINVRIR